MLKTTLLGKNLGFSVSAKAALLLLLFGISAFAQINREPGQWVDGLFLLNNPMGGRIPLVDENNVAKWEIPLLQSVTDFPIESVSGTIPYYSYWHGDRLYTLASVLNQKREDGSFFHSFIIASWQDGEWSHVATYEPKERLLIEVIPCDNNRFIVVSDKRDLMGNPDSSLSPFVRASVVPSSKKLRLDTSIDHGLDELRKFMSGVDCFGLALHAKTIMTDRYAILINPKTGLYWVFSLEKANLVKAGNIFRKVKPEWVAKGGATNAVLCAHPEKDGTVLISAQAEEAFTTEAGDASREVIQMANQGAFGRPGSPDFDPNGAIALIRAREKEIAEKNPFIVWYRLHPENGKVEKLALPPEGAAIDRDGGKNDSWRPMPDGSVRMGPTKVTGLEEKPRPKSTVTTKGSDRQGIPK